MAEDLNARTSEDLPAVLLSCDPVSEAFLREELAAIFPALPPLEWLDDGLALARPGLSFAECAAALDRHAPAFLRHIAPAQAIAPLRADESDLDALRQAALAFAPRLDIAQTFAVQTRIIGEGQLPYRKFSVNRALSDALQEATGAPLDTRAPAQALSVLCLPDRGFLGLSWTAQNRSAWPGGMRRFKAEEGQISRAEFKLLEAFEVFALEIPKQGIALDMGAAPGGWTRVLRARGLKVVAVDPAELDPRLRRDKGITHIRRPIQDYLPGAGMFSVLVNDMRMEPEESVGMMLQARDHLEPGGLAILTLKLPRELPVARRNLSLARRALERLRTRYTVRGARQLYHNRSEVTVALEAAAD